MKFRYSHKLKKIEQNVHISADLQRKLRGELKNCAAFRLEYVIQYVLFT